MSPSYHSGRRRRRRQAGAQHEAGPGLQRFAGRVSSERRAPAETPALFLIREGSDPPGSALQSCSLMRGCRLCSAHAAATRLDIPGLVQHVIARGIERREIFRTIRTGGGFSSAWARLSAATLSRICKITHVSVWQALLNGAPLAGQGAR